MQQLFQFIRDYYQTDQPIALHRAHFAPADRANLLKITEHGNVSSVSPEVIAFEQLLCQTTNSDYAIATVNATSALHLVLHQLGVCQNDLVITQALSFVASANAIRYTGAEPVFLDIDADTLSLSPTALLAYLEQHCKLIDEQCIELASGKTIKAVMVVYTFGHPPLMKQLKSICEQWHLSLIEDAAEAFGSTLEEHHPGFYGDYAVLSFNGNKIVTTGGGGAILTNNPADAQRLMHLSSTAKQAHPYRFHHDELGFNYRMPGINAALGLAQVERLDKLVTAKRGLAVAYAEFFKDTDYQFIKEPANAHSNYWLNAISCADSEQAEQLLIAANEQGINMREVWQPLNQLPMYNNCRTDQLAVTQTLAPRLVNLPSYLSQSVFKQLIE